MEQQKAKKKKRIWIIAVCAVLVLAAISLAVTVLPVQIAYRTAVQTSEQAPYAEAKACLEETVVSLSGRLFAERACDDLKMRSAALTDAEIERAIEADELAYASELLREIDPERATALDRELAYRAADALERAGEDEQALAGFLALGSERDAKTRAAAIRERLDFQAANAVFTGANYDEAMNALYALHTQQGDEAAAALEEQKATARRELIRLAEGRLAAGAWYTAGVGESPWIAGDARYPEAPQEADRVVSGLVGVLYLKDGAVFCMGETYGAEEEIAAYTDVIGASTGLTHALFLHTDGQVSAVGSKAFGRLETGEWKDIVSVAAGAWHSVGVTSDGKAVACGGNSQGQCEVSGWSDLAAVSAGLWHTVGLLKDGTAVACGNNAYGQCDVSEWTDLVAIVCGACHTVGLKSDGTVVACGDNAAGQCGVSVWSDVAAVAAGAYHTVGVRLDGSLIAAGVLPQELPEEALFASDWTVASIEDETPKQPQLTAYIEGENETFGPCLYLDEHGAAMICLDDTELRTLFRVDMLATKDSLPCGRVTTPEATGHIIHMNAELPYLQAQKHHAVIAFTGDYLGFTSNRKAVMIRNGVVYYDREETTTMALMPDGTMQIYQRGETHAEQLLALGVKDSFSFGPILVQDGKNVADPLKTECTMRVAFGYSDPYHYITAVTVRDRKLQMSFPMIADVCVHYGCRTAYNLDGGHSTSLVFMGRELSLTAVLTGEVLVNYRGLSDIIMFLENDSVVFREE